MSERSDSIELYRLSPALPKMLFSNTLALRDHFRNIDWPAPSILLNFVSNAKAELVGATGSSRDISNSLDYESLIGLRMASDGILTSAKTARIEKYRRSKHAPLALVSRSGEFSEIPAVLESYAGPEDSLVYLLVPSKHARKTRASYQQPWIRVIKIGRGSALRTTFALTRLGWRRVVVEAGIEYSSFLIKSSAAKFINLTIVDFGEESPLAACREFLSKLGVLGATLILAERVENTLFTRWTDF
jgi:riboflavin biosynthesis pyrimidine reductase